VEESINVNEDEQRARKWRLYKGTWEVWLPLLSHDKNASIWLITQLYTIGGAQPSHDLISMFSWMRSPQGGHYWNHLNDILDEGEQDV